VFDVSASVDASELTQLRNAAKSFISMNGGLGGTGSEVALFRFAETAAQVGSSRHSIATASGIASASTAIDGISASGIGQYTNWDHALRTVAASNLGTFDVVLVLTDGDPTASRNNANSSTQWQTTDVTMRNIEQAVFSANLVKSQMGPANQKTFILPVGVGMDPDSLHNLNAISAVGS